MGVGSCYQPGADTNCCGCVNWDEEGFDVPPYPYTEKCINSNPDWIDSVFPQLSWQKEGCPTAYTYPYDDISSTFTCQNNQDGGINSVNYQISFCPEKKSNYLGQVY